MKHTNTRLSLVGPLQIFLNFHIIYERFCKRSLDWPPGLIFLQAICNLHRFNLERYQLIHFMPFIEDSTAKTVIELIERVGTTSYCSMSSLIISKNELHFPLHNYTDSVFIFSYILQ